MSSGQIVSRLLTYSAQVSVVKVRWPNPSRAPRNQVQGITPQIRWIPYQTRDGHGNEVNRHHASGVGVGRVNF